MEEVKQDVNQHRAEAKNNEKRNTGPAANRADMTQGMKRINEYAIKAEKQCRIPKV